MSTLPPRPYRRQFGFTMWPEVVTVMDKVVASRRQGRSDVARLAIDCFQNSQPNVPPEDLVIPTEKEIGELFPEITRPSKCLTVNLGPVRQRLLGEIAYYQDAIGSAGMAARLIVASQLPGIAQQYC